MSDQEAENYDREEDVTTTSAWEDGDDDNPIVEETVSCSIQMWNVVD